MGCSHLSSIMGVNFMAKIGQGSFTNINLYGLSKLLGWGVSPNLGSSSWHRKFTPSLHMYMNQIFVDFP